MNRDSARRDVVLVVDDTPETLAMLNDTLDQAGLTVLVALEGAQALAIAQTLHPDLILLDALMPNMDGFETCRRLKAQPGLAQIPVIFMTGLSDSDSVVKGLESGGVDYITKPIRSNELLARIRVHLANARLTQSAHSALDSAGQTLIATAPDGTLRWATTQAHQLFEQAGADTDWLETVLPPVIRQMLEPHYNRDKGRIVHAADQALEVRYLSQTHANEYLFRLTDLDRLSETDTLRETFALTAREAEVLLWIARGKTNREIAIILSMSPRTVNKHLEQVFRKLGVENRTSAAVLALKHVG